MIRLHPEISCLTTSDKLLVLGKEKSVKCNMTMYCNSYNKSYHDLPEESFSDILPIKGCHFEYRTQENKQFIKISVIQHFKGKTGKMNITIFEDDTIHVETFIETRYVGASKMENKKCEIVFDNFVSDADFRLMVYKIDNSYYLKPYLYYHTIVELPLIKSNWLTIKAKEIDNELEEVITQNCSVKTFKSFVFVTSILEIMFAVSWLMCILLK